MGFAMRTQHTWSRSISAVGIDLGTSVSRIGIWQHGDVMIIPCDQGSTTTPSCVAYTDRTTLVGEAAESQAETNLENTIFAPQKLLGVKMESPVVQWYIQQFRTRIVPGEDGRPMVVVRYRGEEHRLYPEEIMATLLTYLRRNAEALLGSKIMDTVIAVPSCFGKNQRQALLEACSLARLEVLELIKSPTAAAIAYSLTNVSQTRHNVLVCDIGASYFDFALLALDNGKIVEKAFSTECLDIDGVMFKRCQRDLKKNFSITLTDRPVERLILRRACTRAKQQLSQFPLAWVCVNSISKSTDYKNSISREQMEELCQVDLEPVLDSINFCLEDSGIEKQDVDEVVLVGGGARMPALRHAIRNFFFGQAPKEVLRPERAGVLGATAHATVLKSRSLEPQGFKVPPELQHIDIQQVSAWSVCPTSSCNDVKELTKCGLISMAGG